jgi:hypothetical protein
MENSVGLRFEVAKMFCNLLDKNAALTLASCF